MLIVQSPRNPAAVRHALFDVMPESIDELVAISAYASVAGSQLLEKTIREKIGDNYTDLVKTIAVSIDFGITEPEAIEFWLAQKNCSVYIAGTAGLDDGSLVGDNSFHPKIYLLGSAGEGFGGVVGSANLTSRGLTINSEAVWSATGMPPAAAHDVIAALMGDLVPASEDIVHRYREIRSSHSWNPGHFDEIAEVPAPPEVDVGRLPVFWDVIAGATVNAFAHEQFWVEVVRAEGGSGNQIELPRGANRFFGSNFDAYEAGSVVPIITPTLVAGPRSWNDRPLRWHGDNRMERFNMPTLAQGGYQYANTALLFRRLSSGSFEFLVSPWDGDLARSWRIASQEAGLLFRVGQSSARVAGLIPS